MIKKRGIAPLFYHLPGVFCIAGSDVKGKYILRCVMSLSALSFRPSISESLCHAPPSFLTSRRDLLPFVDHMSHKLSVSAGPGTSTSLKSGGVAPIIDFPSGGPTIIH